MTASVSMGSAARNHAERWRWLLYVVLAIVGALLTFVGARAQQKATDDATFRELIDRYCAARSAGRAGCWFTSIFPLRRPEARVLTKRAGRFAHGARNVQDGAVLLECSSGLSIQALGKSLHPLAA